MGCMVGARNISEIFGVLLSYLTNTIAEPEATAKLDNPRKRRDKSPDAAGMRPDMEA